MHKIKTPIEFLQNILINNLIKYDFLQFADTRTTSFFRRYDLLLFIKKKNDILSKICAGSYSLFSSYRRWLWSTAQIEHLAERVNDRQKK